MSPSQAMKREYMDYKKINKAQAVKKKINEEIDPDKEYLVEK